MAEGKPKAVGAHTRALIQMAHMAIRDVYDAITELVTNSDDRYQILGIEGAIEIDIERGRGNNCHILRVRDFADGMDSSTMEKKLSFIGGRDSGLSDGAEVRGTHSRGAKDVAALGRVVFESFAGDGQYHSSEITPFLDFIPHGSKQISSELRCKTGLLNGTGTVVTIELNPTQSLPQYDTLKNQIPRLVALRSVLADERRKVVLRDVGRARESTLHAPMVDDTIRLKESLSIPGYPDAAAKLIIWRAKKRFEKEPSRFRMGGIQVESRRAIHEATLFAPELETDPHAFWFHGRLVCHYIDNLCNEFDDRFEGKLTPLEQNPIYPLDPSRKSGLSREHPFVKALFAEALKQLRPLVEEERRREEHQQASIENAATRKRLNELEKAAFEFMQDFQEEDEPTRDPNGKRPESKLLERGYLLSPPFTQIIVGHSCHFWLSIRQEAFPEIEVGATVQIERLSDEISVDRRFCGLEPHPAQEGVLRALWKVTALRQTSATGLRVRIGPITAESVIEVLESEADKYSHVHDLCFGKRLYRVRTDRKNRGVKILAPLSLVSKPTSIEVSTNSSHFEISGQRVIQPVGNLGIALCDIRIRSDGEQAKGVLMAKLGTSTAVANIISTTPMGADFSIKLEDIDLGNQRYRWRQNVLEIAARHPSLKRYLGDKERGFPGQETPHFKILVAEVVADAVCARLLQRNIQANPEEFEDADWDQYYAEYSKYMTKFLPIAHKIVQPQVD